MNILLRSLYAASQHDDAKQLFQNYLLFEAARLDFVEPQDIVLWTFIRNFARTYNEIPNVSTLKSHFEDIGEPEIIDRLALLDTLSPLMKGDFRLRLEHRVTDRKKFLVKEILTTAGRIAHEGVKFQEGKKEKFLRGPVDAIKYVMGEGHEILTPALAYKVYGNVTSDATSAIEDYEKKRDDPLKGEGLFCGIDPIDEVMRGAKPKELWTHAAFTGGLKCVAGDTLLYDLVSGKLRTVKDLYETGDAPVLHALDESTWTMTTVQASSVIANGVRPILKLRTRTGREIRVSDNHPFMLPSGWTDAGDIKEGDWVAVPAELPAKKGKPSSLTDPEVALLGYLLGDGSIGSDINFTNGNLEIFDDFIHLLKQMGYKESNGDYAPFAGYRIYKDHNNSDLVKVSYSLGKTFPWESPLRILLENLGLWGCRSTNKFIPGELWDITDAQVWLLLSSLWSTDGRIGVDASSPTRKPKTVLSYGSRSRKLACGIQALLQRVGVPSTVSKIQILYKGTYRPFFSVLVTTSEGKRKFLQTACVIGKKQSVKEALEHLSCKKGTDWLPPALLDPLDNNVRAKTRKGGWHYAKWAKKKTKITRDTLSRLADASENEVLIRKSKGNVRWERVTSITPDGKEMTYDLSVPVHHNFVANGFITHNSTWALNWMYNQAVYCQRNILMVSLEMPYAQVRNLLFSMHSMHHKFRQIRVDLGIQTNPHPVGDLGLRYERLRDGLLETNEEIFYLEHVAPDLSDPENGYGAMEVHEADHSKSGFTVLDLRHKAELVYSKTPIAMIIVDHGGLLHAQKNYSSTTESQNEVIRDLKRLALGFNGGQGIAVFNLFQISRTGYNLALKNEGKYNLTALSYANEAERSSDVVTASWLDEERADNNRALWQCLKSRDTRPFKDLEIRIEWPCRRMLTLSTGDPGEQANDDMGQAIDDEINSEDIEDDK